MDNNKLIRRELRSAREELVRKRARQSDDPPASTSQLPLMPERDDAFLRLALMSVEDLETHINRLERDLTDLKAGIDRPDVEIE
jgi:ribosomal protein L29